MSGYASSIKHHPNGAVASYTLANGIAHSLTQNTRGLPLVNRDAGVMQDQYAYDANGNVASITDQQGNAFNRTMGYDGLDRLTSTSAPNVWGSATYTYDPVDNLRTAVVGVRNSTFNHDATNRLTSVVTNGGTTLYGYDVRGNVRTKGGQTFTFDIANRMSASSLGGSYVYDGHGRRIRINGTDGSMRIQVYGNAGKLLWATQGTSTTQYVYLGDKQIAETTNGVTQYAHTDALGTPVAHTNASGGLMNRARYEPYGYVAQGTKPSAATSVIGFTGHVQDSQTDLVYMQQRYYDPIAGRFLSIDPVLTDAATGKSFGRYHYAADNPYTKLDRDGRDPEHAYLPGGMTRSQYQATNVEAAGNAIAVGVHTAQMVPQIRAAATIIKGALSLASRSGGGAQASPNSSKEGPLPDNALVCRGGTCTADRFASGSGVTVDANGKMDGVSVNSGAGKSLSELTVGIPNKQVGVTTVGDVRAAGGDVVRSPTPNNPNHCTMCGITPQKAEELMTPTVTNPNAR